MILDTFSITALTVAFAEIGDRTQLLSLVLVSKYRKPHIICLAIVFATIINHFVSAWFGYQISHYISETYLKWILIISFLGFAVWVLVPDKLDEGYNSKNKFGVFLTSFVAFSLAEIGDKTQIATIALGAKFSNELGWVVFGTTVGMILANYPVLIFGEKLIKKIPLKTIRFITSILFLFLAVLTFFKFG